MAVAYYSVTAARLDDLRRFSEGHGKFRYCSCMRWRLASTAFQKSTKEERIERLEKLVEEKVPVGVLAYLNGEPVGWCSVAPRETYDALARSKTLATTDGESVWSVVCFFIDNKVRRRGLTTGLLKAAVKYAVSKGAKIVEGYPVERGARLYTYMGSPSAFKAAGFKEIERPPGQRPVYRYISES
jgi:L-amino acid N-acyltransferase YncA